MKLCTCNQCGGIFEDMNPQSGAKEYKDNPEFEPLIKLYENTSDLSTGYWGCPKCCTDSYLSDTVDAELVEAIYSGIKWVCTDADTNQYGRRLSTYKYEFKEDGRQQAIIDLERYSWIEIIDNCESYYENMDELFKQYAEHSTWIIAEILFEMNVIKS